MLPGSPTWLCASLKSYNLHRQSAEAAPNQTSLSPMMLWCRAAVPAGRASDTPEDSRAMSNSPSTRDKTDNATQCTTF